MSHVTTGVFIINDNRETAIRLADHLSIYSVELQLLKRGAELFFKTCQLSILGILSLFTFKTFSFYLGEAGLNQHTHETCSFGAVFQFGWSNMPIRPYAIDKSDKCANGWRSIGLDLVEMSWMSSGYPRGKTLHHVPPFKYRSFKCWRGTCSCWTAWKGETR